MLRVSREATWNDADCVDFTTLVTEWPSERGCIAARRDYLNDISARRR
jgi:hypothetical protein